MGRDPRAAGEAHGATHLWSRGEEIITHRFPEIVAAATHLPDGTVLDGEVLAFRDDRPLPFSALQQRIGRQKQVAQMARAVPVVFMTYDLLEQHGEDIRPLPLGERRRGSWRSFGRTPHPRRPAALADGGGRELGGAGRQRAGSRARGVEGLMLKRAASAYGVGRKHGDWWKWKIEPYTIDAVLIYAQPGSGKRASLLTDYTFGVWDNGQLVPVAKAYSGLSNEEIGEMDRWIRRHTLERFGPVRHVEPVHVFELGFEGIARSPRHRAGIAVRFPRMLRWRKDKRAGGGRHARPAAAPARERRSSLERNERCTPVTAPAAVQHDDATTRRRDVTPREWNIRVLRSRHCRPTASNGRDERSRITST